MNSTARILLHDKKRNSLIESYLIIFDSKIVQNWNGLKNTKIAAVDAQRQYSKTDTETKTTTHRFCITKIQYW